MNQEDFEAFIDNYEIPPEVLKESEEIDKLRKKHNETTINLLDSLLPVQREKYHAINWLFHSPRATGKTHLLAIVYIIHAMSNIETTHVVDHWGTQNGAVHLLNLINTICIKHGIIMNINRQENSIVFRGYRDEPVP